MKENEKKLISVVIPVYNEEEVLDELYKELVILRNKANKYDFEFLFLNDGSKDKSLEMIKGFRQQDDSISYINFARNFGKELSVLGGLDYARGDAVIIMDADLQDPPEVIHEFIKYWEMGYDDVYGRRRTRKDESWLKKFTAKRYYRFMNKISRVPIQIDTGDFRLLDRRVVNLLKKTRETSRSNKTLFSWVGYKKKEVLFDRPERIAGKTKYNYGTLINLAIDGITSVTTGPLKIAFLAAFILFFLLSVYIVVLVILALNNMPFSSINYIIMSMIFLSIINLVVLGIIGEYLGRIFNETKNRPTYFVDEYNGVKETNE